MFLVILFYHAIKVINTLNYYSYSVVKSFFSMTSTEWSIFYNLIRWTWVRLQSSLYFTISSLHCVIA